MRTLLKKLWYLAPLLVLGGGLAQARGPLPSRYTSVPNPLPGTVETNTFTRVVPPPPASQVFSSGLDEQLGDTLFIESNWRDQLGTNSYTRFLAYTRRDTNFTNGVVKLVWQDMATATATRNTHYTTITDVDGLLAFGPIRTVGGPGDGYPVLDVDDVTGQQYIALHSDTEFPDNLFDTAVMTESTLVPGFYNPHWVPRHQDAQAVWPKLAIQHSPDGVYAHTVNIAGSGDGTAFDKWVFYDRMLFHPDGTVTDETQGTDDQYTVTTYDEDMEAVVAANDNGKVAIVVPVSRHLKDGEDNGHYDGFRLAQTCNDVYLWTSDDYGATWNWNNPLNITNFIPPDRNLLPDTTAANKDTLRAYADVNCVVDNQGYVHVTFTTITMDYIRSQGESSYANRLWYWNSRDSLCIQMQGEIWNGAVPGAWQTFTNQCQLSVDPLTRYVWAAWSQYGEPGDTVHFTQAGVEYYAPLDVSASTSTSGGQFALGDIYVSMSPDWYHWTKPINVTNTRNMDPQIAINGGLAPYQCRSEIHPSLAENVGGPYLHLLYEDDRDGGRNFTWNEGTQTENQMMYQRVSKYALIDSFNARHKWVRNYPIHVDSSRFWQDPENWVWGESIGSAPETKPLQPNQFTLEQNYPNPFNPSTRIAFTLKARGTVKLTVYDVLGREVATLVHRTMNPGHHVVSFLGDQLPSGVYFYQLSSGTVSQVRKMVLMK